MSQPNQQQNPPTEQPNQAEPLNQLQNPPAELPNQPNPPPDQPPNPPPNLPALMANPLQLKWSYFKPEFSRKPEEMWKHIFLGPMTGWKLITSQLMLR